jgi:hypothetical protein
LAGNLFIHANSPHPSSASLIWLFPPLARVAGIH